MKITTFCVNTDAIPKNLYTLTAFGVIFVKNMDQTVVDIDPDYDYDQPGKLLPACTKFLVQGIISKNGLKKNLTSDCMVRGVKTIDYPGHLLDKKIYP